MEERRLLSSRVDALRRMADVLAREVNGAEAEVSLLARGTPHTVKLPAQLTTVLCRCDALCPCEACGICKATTTKIVGTRVSVCRDPVRVP